MATTPDNHIDLQILKYLQDNSTLEERQFLENWMAQSASNTTYFEEVKAVWEESEKLGDFDQIDTDAQWEVFKAKTGVFIKSKQKVNNRLLKIAASLVLLLGIGYFMNKALFSEVTLLAESGKENKFVLPDASIIWLRDGSTLTYNKDFRGNKRNVTLVGEGYFEVKENRAKPFVVRSGKTLTEVLGTSFNLGTNFKTKTTTLVLIEGKVAFSYKDKKEILLPGEKVSTTIDGSLIKEKNKDQNFDAWKSGILRFDNTSFAEVITTLEKYYQIKFNVENKELFSCALTTNFEKESLQQVLETLEILFGITYTIQKKESLVLITGGSC